MSDKKIEAALRAQNETLARLETALSRLTEATERTFQFLAARISRPYYCLADGWALTHLDSGQPFYVNTRDTTVTPWILMGGHWETNVEKPLLSYAQPGMHVLDIGAHFGYYTVKLGAKIGASGRLLSFEPNPEMNKYLEQNIVLNGLLFMTHLHKCALGPEQGKAKLAYTAGNMAQANLLGDQPAEFSFEVPVETLDNLVGPSPPIDLIKLDAEGYEPLILRGGRRTMRNSPQCAVMLELNLTRWERFAGVEDLPDLLGAEKVIFAVTATGTLQKMEIGAVADFLKSCAFTENYFFFCPADSQLKQIAHLIEK